MSRHRTETTTKWERLLVFVSKCRYWYGKLNSKPRERWSEWTRVYAAYAQFMMLLSECEAEQKEIMRHAYGRYMRHSHWISFVSWSICEHVCCVLCEYRLRLSLCLRERERVCGSGVYEKGSAAIARSKTVYLLFKGASEQTVRVCDCNIVRFTYYC